MPDEKPISDAFAKPPRQAAAFSAQYEASEAAQAARPPMTSRPDEYSQVRMSRDPVLDKPYQPPQEEAQQPQAPQPESGGAQSDRQLAQRLLEERKALQAEVNALRERNAKFEEAYRQASQRRAEAQFAQQLAESPDLQNLDTVDAEDAQKIASVAARAVSGQIASLQQELVRQRDERRQAAANYRQRMQQAQERKRALEVTKAHPDFFDLYKNPKFLEYLNGRDGLSSKTRGDVAFEEFQRGNTAYVNDFLDRFKKGYSPDNYRSVAPVQVAGSNSYGGGYSKKPTVNYSLKDINDLYQMHRIGQDQYRAMLNDLRAAE